MRHVAFICLLTASSLLKVSPLNAGPLHNWSYRLGGTGANVAYDVAIDGSGDVVITGTFAGTMNLGGGPLTSAGSFDVFLARFDAHGVHQWSKSFGGAGADGGRAVAVDGAGNVTMTGYFRGPANLGGNSLPGYGGDDIFVAGFDAAGLHRWSRVYGSALADEGQDIVADASGNVIVTGHCSGVLDFGPGVGTPAFGGTDFFVLKLDAAGRYQWSRVAGSLTNDAGYGATIDGSNSVVLTGMFNSNVDFGGGLLRSAGSSDIFVVKYAEDGVHQWSKRFGASGADIGRGIGVDATGSVVVTGLGNHNDVCLCKYDTDGVEQWARTFDSSSMAESMDLAVSAVGMIVITGYLRGTVDFGGGPVTSAGADDIFFAICDASGAHQWSQRFGNTGDDWGYAGAFDPSGDFIATGMFARSLDFGGGPLASAGSSDIYLVKFGDEAAVVDTTPPTITVVLDRNVLWPPNHRLVTVCAKVTVTDNGNEKPAFSLVSITSNEPEDEQGDGRTRHDITGTSFGTPDLCFELRAERAGNGIGRVYEIVYCAQDASGNASCATVLVRVPHNLSADAMEDEDLMSTAITSAHPNPFNPQTTLKYILATEDRVQIEIYDARGSLVHRLVDRIMPAGEHSVIWNGVDRASRPVGSGIYFVRMTAGSYTETRKIVLVK